MTNRQAQTCPKHHCRYQCRCHQLIESKHQPVLFIMFIPLSTVFNFQRVCEDVWRPSRMESECVFGEGIEMMFPHQRCSIFNHPTLGKLYSVYVFITEYFDVFSK